MKIALTFFAMMASIFAGTIAQAETGIDIDQLAQEKLNWIDDASLRAQVIDYARAGNPQVETNAPGCTEEFPDTLGSGEFLFCVNVTTLPQDVAIDIKKMEAARFDNISDYDQRVTKFLVVRHDGSLYRFLHPNDVRMLAAMLDIKAEHVGRIYFSSPEPTAWGYLNALRSLYVGEDFVDKTSLFEHVSALSNDSKFIHVSFGPDEISLYPGGGFTTEFTFFINPTYLIYAKTEGWNS